MFTSREFLADVAASAGRIFFAFFVSALIGVPLGILMSSFKSLEASF